MPAGPKYFIVRRRETRTLSVDGRPIYEATHTIVPLIPVDQLPDWVEVTGVPRNLELGDTTGMTNLGVFEGVDPVLSLRFADSAQTASQQQPATTNGVEGLAPLDDDDDDGAVKTEHGKNDAPTSADEGVCTGSSSGEEEAKTVTADEVASFPPGGRKQHPQQKKPWGAQDLKHHQRALQQQRQEQQQALQKRKKQEEQFCTRFCQEWCHHGVCSRARCDLKHKMPRSPRGLRKMGLGRLPPWYCQQYGIDAQSAERPQGTRLWPRQSGLLPPKGPNGHANGNIRTPPLPSSAGPNGNAHRHHYAAAPPGRAQHPGPSSAPGSGTSTAANGTSTPRRLEEIESLI